MKRRIHHRTTTALAVLLALGIAGCGDGDGDDPIAAVGAAIGTTGTPQTPSDTDPGESEGASPVTGGETPMPPTTSIDPDPEPEPMPVQPAEIWRTGYEGTIRSRYNLVGNDDLALVLSSELRERGYLTAVSPTTGDELWRLADASFTDCVPAVLGNGDVVAHLDAETDAGGNDRSYDLALIDGESGVVKDTWEPGNGALQSCTTTAGLLATDSGTVVHAVRGLQTALSSTGDSLEPSWTRNWSRDADGDPLSAGRSPDFWEHAAVIGERLYMGAAEMHEDGFERGVTLYRIDAASGAGVSRLELPLRSLFGIQVAGPGKLLVTGQDKDRGENTAVLVGGAGAATPEAALAIDWSRTFDGNGDGVTRAPSDVSIALGDGAFASWSTTDAGATVTEFDLATGQANWSAPTSSFENNQSIVSLPGGGYAVFSFGGNFLEAFDANGDPLWEVAALESSFGASGMRVLAGNVVLSGRTDDGWGFLGVGPLQ